MKKWLCFALALCLCLTMAGCGGDAEDGSATPTGHSSAPVPDPDLTVANCYTFTENKDGTYSYSVEWRGGGRIYVKENMQRPVSFVEAGEDVLIIEGQEGTGVGARWATFCDIERGRVSETCYGYLAAVDSCVAFVEQRTDMYHVFVRDLFESHEILAAYTMEGLVIPDGGDVLKDFALSEEGVLTVTYPTEAGDKVITVDLTAL